MQIKWLGVNISKNNICIRKQVALSLSLSHILLWSRMPHQPAGISAMNIQQQGGQKHELAVPISKHECLVQ